MHLFKSHYPLIWSILACLIGAERDAIVPGHVFPTGPGSCTFDQKVKLEKMLRQMKEISAFASEATSASAQSIDPKTLDNTGSFFATPLWDAHPDSPVTKRKYWLQTKVSQIGSLITGVASDEDDVQLLMCDSTGLEWVQPDDLIPEGFMDAPNGESYGEYLLGEGTDPALVWIFFLGRDASGNRADVTIVTFLKSKFPGTLVNGRRQPFPSYAGSDKPTICALKDVYAETLFDTSANGIIILCPQFWTRKGSRGDGSATFELPLLLEVGSQTPGTALDALEPRWFTWYEQMVAVAKGAREFAPALRMRRDPNQQSPVTKEQLQTKAFWEEIPGKQAHSAWQSLSLSVYDKASPRETEVDQWLCVRNPSSYAWYSISLYLTRNSQNGLVWWSGEATNPLPAAALQRQRPQG